MKALSDNEFAERVMQIAGPEEPFRPHAVYSPDGDCIEFFLRPDSFYADRADGLLTLYRSIETDNVVGCLITGMKAEMSAVH